MEYSILPRPPNVIWNPINWNVHKHLKMLQSHTHHHVTTRDCRVLSPAPRLVTVPVWKHQFLQRSSRTINASKMSGTRTVAFPLPSQHQCVQVFTFRRDLLHNHETRPLRKIDLSKVRLVTFPY